MVSEQDKTMMRQMLTFWEYLNEEDKQLLYQHTTQVTYQKGTGVHNGENDCIGVLLIIKGELRTYILSEDGKEITLFRLGDKDVCILSASCILQNITFDVHIDAETDTQVLLIPASIFKHLCEHNIYVENFSYKETAERFSDVMWAMQQILLMSIDQRLAIFLLDECKKTGSNNLLLTHSQIAKYIGSAREVVTRMLKYFVTEGIVELTRGAVTITNRKRLEVMANGVSA